MEQYSKLQKEYQWPQIRTLLTGRIGKERTAAVFRESGDLVRKYGGHYRDKKGFAKTHAAAAYHIAAIYIPLRKAVGETEAAQILGQAWKPGALRTCAKYDRIPPGLFIRLCRIIACTAFGQKAGFDRKDISGNAREVRFDVYGCPYVNILTELGCPEICPVVCRQDEYTYGGMRRIVFERTRTLGSGDDRCDFCYRIRKKEE